MTPLAETEARAQDRDAEALSDILRFSVAAIRRVENFSCRTRTFRRVDAEPKAAVFLRAAELGPEGFYLLHETDIVQDRTGGRAKCVGRYFTISSENDAMAGYFRFERAYDGHLYPGRLHLKSRIEEDL